jgi:hypothetical protein
MIRPFDHRLGVELMQDMRAQLEALQKEAANCQFISDQATNAEKKRCSLDWPNTTAS